MRNVIFEENTQTAGSKLQAANVSIATALHQLVLFMFRYRNPDSRNYLTKWLTCQDANAKKGYNNLLQMIQQADGSVVHTIKHIHSWSASILQLHDGITAFLEAKESEF